MLDKITADQFKGKEGQGFHLDLGSISYPVTLVSVKDGDTEQREGEAERSCFSLLFECQNDDQINSAIYTLSNDDVGKIEGVYAQAVVVKDDNPSYHADEAPEGDRWNVKQHFEIVFN